MAKGSDDLELVSALNSARGVFGIAATTIVVLSAPALVANNRLVVSQAYWDRWYVNIPLALLSIAVLVFALGLVRGAIPKRYGWLFLSLVTGALWILAGWWVYLFIQPVTWHMLTKSGAEFELVSDGTYSIGVSSRRSGPGCQQVNAFNPQLGEFRYCIPSDKAYLATGGQVVLLQVDVSPTATWIAGAPNLKVDDYEAVTVKTK